jgi:hypothetical protein
MAGKKRTTKKRVKGRKSRAIRKFIITEGKFGPSAVLLDSRNRSVNAINGGSLDSPALIRRIAKESWPNSKERKTLPKDWGGEPLAKDK